MRRPARRGEDGFTLPELLVTISIVGIIGAALTGAVFLGFRITDATGARVARSSAIQALTAYFTEDVQRAELVGTTALAEPSGECVTAPGRIVRLKWTEENVPHAVVYTLDPPTGGEQDLVRWDCRGTVAIPRVIGHLVHDDAAPVPIEVRCDGGPCPDAPGSPATVTLRIYTDPSASPAAPVEFTVRRRTT